MREHAESCRRRGYGGQGRPPATVACTPMVMMPWLGGKTDKLVDNNPSLLNDSTNISMKEMTGIVLQE
ncbi:hypothetical protein ABU162_30065 [Paenibacillus thiaminolyticus]|uniref:hypothetical protein n=1 Tax=Paenibacillus thiaminolyticus TaxID=49283 RepID=UPI0035A5C0C8